MTTMQPNLLFLYPDQMRYDWTEAYGAVPVKTPNLSRLTQVGVDFRRAVTPSPLCAPARACLASGKEYDRCRVPGNGQDYPLDQTTFYMLLRDAGYRVLGCGKFDLHKPSLDWGGDGKRLLTEWGFTDGIDSEGKWDGVRAYRDNPTPVGPHLRYLAQRGLAEVHAQDYDRRKGDHAAVFPTPLPEEAYCDNWIGQNGLDLLRATPVGTPWFLQVNFNGPHEPWDITEDMERRCRGVDHPPPAQGDPKLTAEEHNAVRQNYSAMVENIDRWVGLYLAELEERGELENTLIVFSSDHGEMLGDHGQWSKSKPEQASVGVPLVVSGPGVQRGVVRHEPVTTLDLAATFLDYAGVATPEEMDARTLRPCLEGSGPAPRTHVLSGLQNWRAVLEGNLKLIHRADGRTALFDLNADRHELNNLSHTLPADADRLKKLLPEGFAA